MANHYSTNYSSSAAATAVADGFTPHVGEVHGRLRYKRMHFASSGALTINDVVRMGKFKSNDRIISLHLSADDMGTAGDVSVGLYESSSDARDGAVIDLNLFASAVDVNAAAIYRTDVTNESGVITADGAGRELWYQANIGGGTYTEDPGESWDLCLEITEATTAAGDMVLEATYVAGD